MPNAWRRARNCDCSIGGSPGSEVGALLITRRLSSQPLRARPAKYANRSSVVFASSLCAEAVTTNSMQRGVDQLRQPVVVYRARLAGPRLAVQPVDASLNELRAPLAHGAGVKFQTRCDRTVGLAVGTGQNDPRPVAQRRGQRTTGTKPTSCARSSPINTNVAFGRPLAIALSPLGKIPQGLQYLC